MNAARRIVRVICLFNGVCAVVCGGFMMAGAAGVRPRSTSSSASSTSWCP